MADYAPVQETLAAPTGPPIDPDVLDQRRKLAQALIAQAMGGEPIGSWTQGVANLAQALMGGYTVRKANQQEAAGRASAAADLAGIFGDLGGGGTADLPGTEAVSSEPTGDVAEYLRGGARGKASDVYQGMLKRGATPAGAASFAASMQQESGFNPQAYNPGEQAIGGIQWRGPRAAGLKAFAAAQGKPWNSLDTQMDYAVHEMKTSEAGAGQAFFNARTPEEANRALKQYIRYGDKAGPAGSAGWDFRKRLGNTRRILDMMGGGGGETAALPNVDPVSDAPSADVAQFLGMLGQAKPPSSPQDALQSIPNVTPQQIDELRRAPQRPRGQYPPNLRPRDLMQPLGGQPMAFAPSPDVAAFIGGGGQQPQPAGLSIGDGTVARVPQPRPNLAQALALPPVSGRGTVPLPPVQPVARAPQPRPTTPLDPAPGPAAAAPATTASIPQPQPRRQIFREPSSGAPLSAQEFARQGQNYLTGRGSFADQTPRVAPRTMQEPIAGASGGAPVAGAPAQPRRGLLDALFGRAAPGGPAAAQAAPAGSPVAAGGAVAPAAAPAGGQASRVSALLANPYVSDAVKSAVLARLMPKPQDPFTLGANEKRYDANGNLIATGPDKPEVTSRPLVTPEERAAAGIPPDDKRPYQVDTRGKVDLVGGAGLTVNTGGGGTDKQIFDTLGTSADAARAAVTGLNGIREARAAIKGGIITGSFANERLSLQKLGAFLGVTDPSVIENTETFRAAIAPQVAAMLKATVGSANISNTDREFAEKAAGGNITLDEKSIARLLDVMERAGRTVVETHNKKLDAVYPESGGFTRERALFHVDEPVAPAAVPDATKDAPGSSKETAVRIGTQADYDRLPSGAYYVDDDGSIKVKS